MPSRFEIVQEKIKQTEALLSAYAVRSQIAVERTEVRYTQLSKRDMTEANRDVFNQSSSDFRAVVQENRALKDLLKLKDERIWIQSETIGNLLVVRTVNQMEQEINSLLSDARLIVAERDSYRCVLKS